MEQKICSKCKAAKGESDFYKAKPGRVKTWCKECEKEYQKQLYAKNPERCLERSRNWREKYAAKISEAKKADRVRFYIYELKQKYGISKEQAEHMLKTSGENCGLCGRRFDPSIPACRRNLDHCHSTGRIGAFICSRCNTVLGLINDDEAMLPKIKRYLRKYRKCSTS